MRYRHRDGQATVEMVAILPVLILVAFAAWHVVTWAGAWTRAAGAAAAGVRAERVHRPGVAAARAALSGLESRSAEVHIERTGTTEATVVVDIPVPTISGQRLTLSAKSLP